jgi:hypothetical protein
VARQLHLTCPTCGAARQTEKFGIKEDGAFDPKDAPCYELAAKVRVTGGGYKGISWTSVPVPERVSQALHDRMQTVLDSADASAAGEGAERLICVMCGNRSDPDRLAIREGEFDPNNVPNFDLDLLVSTLDRETYTFSWEQSPIPTNYARVLLARLKEAEEWLQRKIDAASW